MDHSLHILRYLLIIRYIRNNPYCKKTAILDYTKSQFYERGIFEKHGVSERNITRDFKAIESTFGVSIENKNGYLIPRNEQQDPIADQLMGYLDLMHLEIDGGLPDFVQPEKRRSRGTEFLFAFKRAIDQNKIVKFKYKKFYPDKIDNKTVHPHILKESRGRWYLLGLDSQREAKSYGLDRISELEVMDNTFTKNTEIDWNEMYQDSFAMFTDAPVEKVVLSFAERDGNYIEAMPIHSSQKLTHEGNRVIVTLNIRITLDFIMELMSRSWSVEVIAPLHLRQNLHKTYKEAMERNG